MSAALSTADRPECQRVLLKQQQQQQQQQQLRSRDEPSIVIASRVKTIIAEPSESW